MTRNGYPNQNWTHDANYCIIDETTEQGRAMAQAYVDNFPFVSFTHDGKFVTTVVVLENEKQIELERLEQQRLEEEILNSLVPTDREVLLAETEIQTITILMEAGLI